MGNRIFGGVVFLLWGATMTWLLTAKILPHFFDGEPPRPSLSGRMEPTAWRIDLNGQSCGVAVTQAVEGTIDTTEIHSRVLIDSIPLPEVAPKWMTSLLVQLGEIDLDMRNRTTLDSLGNLATLQTRIKLNDLPALIRVSGMVQDGSLRLRLQTGEFARVTQYPWRDSRLLGGELMPDVKLVNVHVGKRWRKEVYSPFGPPNDPVDMVEAEVVERVDILHDGRIEPAYRIEYRAVAVAGVSAEDRLRSVVWVAEDGRVLRQESIFMNARLRFNRLGADESAALADDLLELDRFATTTVPIHAPQPAAEARPGAGGP